MAALLECPGIECWQSLLEDTASPDQRERCERHLEWCPSCQERIDGIEQSSEELRGLAHELGDPTRIPTDPTLVHILGRLIDGKGQERASGVEPADLFFLRPCDRPDLLGLLGEYEVHAVIGQGGMGVVLQAFEPALNRQVAIKVMAPTVAGSVNARRRFTREAQAAAAVSHENIVPVHTVSEEAGLPYLVMQYVVGESVQDRLDRVGPLEVGEVVRIGLQTAAGLAAAHASGLIHRDIKPANLLLAFPHRPALIPHPPALIPHPPAPSPKEGEGEAEGPGCESWSSALLPLSLLGRGGRGGEGDWVAREGEALESKGARVESWQVKITDFGLARMVDDVALTQSGVVAGTPEYMAPEQSRGEELDHRADLFSLGSVMYALCTGLPPFRASTTMGVIHKLNEEQPAPIRSLKSDVPAWLEAFIARMMEKDPAARFQSAAEVAQLLEGYLAHFGQPETVPAPDLSPRPFVVTNGEPDGVAGRTEATQRLRFSGRWVLSRQNGLIICLVVAMLGLAGFGLAPLLFALVTTEQQPEENRQAEMPSPEQVDVWKIAVSKEGNIVAAGAGKWGQPGEIGVWDLTTHEPLRRFSEEEGVASVAISPNGKLLAWGGWSRHVRIWDWAAGKQLFDFPDVGVARVAFSPDGMLLASVTEQKSAQLWDPVGGKLVADLEGDLFRFHCLTFSPNGNRLLAGGGDWKPGGINQAVVWDLASKKQILKLKGHQNAVVAVCYSPDGKTIATGSVDNSIRLWDAESGKQLRIFRGHSRWVESLAFTADGKTLVSGCLDRTVRFWDVAQGKEKGRIATKGEIRSVRFTPDGESLYVGGGLKTLKLFSVATRQELASLWDGSGPKIVAMDRQSVVPPTTVEEVEQERGWLTAAVLVGLGLVLVASLCVAARFSLKFFRVEQSPAVAKAASESVSFACSACGKTLKAKAELAGKNVKCPKCGKAVLVP